MEQMAADGVTILMASNITRLKKTQVPLSYSSLWYQEKFIEISNTIGFGFKTLDFGLN